MPSTPEIQEPPMPRSAPRPRFLLAAILLTAVASLSCRGDATNPGPRTVSLAVVPTFAASGAAGLVTVDRIRFVVRRASDQSLVLDTTVDIADGAETVQVDIQVSASSANEVFLLSLTLFDLDGNEVFTGGPAEVRITAEGNEPVPVEVELQYVGVGANAVAVQILTPDTTLFFGETLALTAQAIDANEQPIPGTPIGWSSLNIQVVDVPDLAVGQGTAGSGRGVTQVMATLLTGQTDAIDVTVTAMPNSVIIQSGGGQRALPDAPLLEGIVVQVLGTDGIGAPDVDVTFAASDGTLTTTTAITDNEGLAQTDWTLGPTEGQQTITVMLPDFPNISGTVLATAVVPTGILGVSDGQRAAVGTAVPSRVQVTAVDGLGVPGVDVDFRTGFGSVSPPIVTTDPGGFAETTWTIGTAEGDQTIDVALPDFTGIMTTMTTTAVTPPPPGTDVVVFNDMNIFDENAMQDPNNQLLVRNLVGFTGSGPRADGTVVWFDKGRSSPCFNNGECGIGVNATMLAEIQGLGLTVIEMSSDTGAVYTQIPPDVKAIFLWNPTVQFTTEEMAGFMQFVAEGGRVVFIGEWDGFYGAAGLATENQFLLDIGAQMTNTGAQIDCGYTLLPPSRILLGHQVTTGLTGLTIACASIINPGPQDFPIMYDLGTNTLVLGGVAVIGQPIGAPPAAAGPTIDIPRPAGLDPTSGTGYRK